MKLIGNISSCEGGRRTRRKTLKTGVPRKENLQRRRGNRGKTSNKSKMKKNGRGRSRDLITDVPYTNKTGSENRKKTIAKR